MQCRTKPRHRGIGPPHSTHPARAVPCVPDARARPARQAVRDNNLEQLQLCLESGVPVDAVHYAARALPLRASTDCATHYASHSQVKRHSTSTSHGRDAATAAEVTSLPPGWAHRPAARGEVRARSGRAAAGEEWGQHRDCISGAFPSCVRWPSARGF